MTRSVSPPIGWTALAAVALAFAPACAQSAADGAYVPAQGEEVADFVGWVLERPLDPPRREAFLRELRLAWEQRETGDIEWTRAMLQTARQVAAMPPEGREAVRPRLASQLREYLGAVPTHPFSRILLASAPAAPAPELAAGPAAAPPSPPGGGLDGVYSGVRLYGGRTQHGTRIVDMGLRIHTFFPDGRALSRPHHEGYARPIDWSRHCTPRDRWSDTYCGTYDMRGNEVLVHWEGGYNQAYQRNGDQLRMIYHHWDGNPPRSGRDEMVDMVRTAPVDGLRLDGRWVYPHDRAVSISFSPDGRFTEQGLVRLSASYGLPDEEFERRRAAPPRGSGTYAISDHTLELRYEGGAVFRFVFILPAHVARSPRPARISIASEELDWSR